MAIKNRKVDEQLNKIFFTDPRARKKASFMQVLKFALYNTYARSGGDTNRWAEGLMIFADFSNNPNYVGRRMDPSVLQKSKIVNPLKFIEFLVVALVNSVDQLAIAFASTQKGERFGRLATAARRLLRGVLAVVAVPVALLSSPWRRIVKPSSQWVAIQREKYAEASRVRADDQASLMADDGMRADSGSLNDVSDGEIGDISFYKVESSSDGEKVERDGAVEKLQGYLELEDSKLAFVLPYEDLTSLDSTLAKHYEAISAEMSAELSREQVTAFCEHFPAPLKTALPMFYNKFEAEYAPRPNSANQILAELKNAKPAVKLAATDPKALDAARDLHNTSLGIVSSDDDTSDNENSPRDKKNDNANNIKVFSTVWDSASEPQESSGLSSDITSDAIKAGGK